MKKVFSPYEPKKKNIVNSFKAYWLYWLYYLLTTHMKCNQGKAILKKLFSTHFSSQNTNI